MVACHAASNPRGSFSTDFGMVPYLLDFPIRWQFQITTPPIVLIYLWVLFLNRGHNLLYNPVPGCKVRRRSLVISMSND